MKRQVMSGTGVDTLRAAFAQSVVATLATQVSAYLRLVSHPEATVQDLLDALDRGPIIGDDAARRLHTRTAIPLVASSPTVNRQFWEITLQQQGIMPENLIRIETIPRPAPALRPVS
jgi:hypothetical protein